MRGVERRDASLGHGSCSPPPPPPPPTLLVLSSAAIRPRERVYSGSNLVDGSKRGGVFARRISFADSLRAFDKHLH